MSIMDKEIEEMKRWDKEKVMNKVDQKNYGKDKWYFCDGAPYATGTMHPGTAYNKSAKDSVIRYKRWKGYNVRAKAGYDTHGLPIEVKVEKDIGSKNKQDIEKYGVEKFIKKCKSFATKHVTQMSKDFKRAGVWMDFDDPYLTYKNEFIESVWGAIKKTHDRGLLYQGVSVLPYCSRCETPMANAELEYSNDMGPSIYVKFKVKDDENKEDNENNYLIIWTTTPWTLVSNMAVMVHPSETYVKVKPDDLEETWIIGKERMDTLSELLCVSFTIIDEMSGKRLNGIEYEHPLGINKDVQRKVVLSDEYVTMNEGTGLVHCAPGHGPEDYVIGKRYGIEPFSPVNEQGNYTKEAGIYDGLNVLKVNDKIIDDLENLNILLHKGTIEHRYPHCWRCKTPLIFRTTKQWFAKISEIKEKMIEEIDKTTWVPEFARTRFSNFVETSPDWCISRQRYWGIPIPVWVNTNDETDYIVIGSFNELKKPIEDYHRPYVDQIVIKKDGKTYKRVPDVLDVWMDSGNVVWANLTKEEKEEYDQAQFIIEGKDQTRGWFYSLLGTGVMAYDKAPYETVMMHGFFVDDKGEKMSKSKGNFIPFGEIVEKYGADAFRLWSLSAVPWEDLPFSWDNIKEGYSFVNTVDNMAVFLKRFGENVKYKEPVINELNIEDKWLISKFNLTLQKCEDNYDKYLFHLANREIVNFLLNDVSRFYIKLIKNREDEKGLEVLKYVYVESLKLLNPITPFVTERCYKAVMTEPKVSICMEEWPKPIGIVDPALISDMELAQEVIAQINAARQEINIKLRWPIDIVKIYPNDDIALTAVQRLSNVIKSMTNVQTIETVKSNMGKVTIELKKDIENPIVIKKVIEHDLTNYEYAINSGKTIELEGIKLTNEEIQIKETVKDYHTGYFTGGKIYTHSKLPKKVVEEGMAREVIRRIQETRKGMKLVETEGINVDYLGDKDIEKIIETFNHMIKETVNAKDMNKVNTMEKMGKEWIIKGPDKEYVLKINATKI